MLKFLGSPDSTHLTEMGMRQGDTLALQAMYPLSVAILFLIGVGLLGLGYINTKGKLKKEENNV